MHRTRADHIRPHDDAPSLRFFFPITSENVPRGLSPPSDQAAEAMRIIIIVGSAISPSRKSDYPHNEGIIVILILTFAAINVKSFPSFFSFYFYKNPSYVKRFTVYIYIYTNAQKCKAFSRPRAPDDGRGGAKKARGGRIAVSDCGYSIGSWAWGPGSVRPRRCCSRWSWSPEGSRRPQSCRRSGWPSPHPPRSSRRSGSLRSSPP